MSLKDKIRARKQNQFRQKQQVNRLFAERIASGMSVAEAATAPYTNITVADGDTVSTIAETNGIQVPDLLAANPELKQVRTGMVLNVPTPGSQVWRDQNVNQGGIGLPSNAALGGATTNPGGLAANTRGFAGGTSLVNPYNNDTPFNAQTLSTVQNQYSPTYRAPYPLYAKSVVPNYTPRPYPLYAGNIQPPTATPLQPKTQTGLLPPGFNNYSMLEENYHFRTLDRVLKTNNYTQADINYLKQIGLIQPAQQVGGGGGGYNYRRYGRGGGGGRSYSSAPRATGTGKVQQGERLPAFSSGNSSFGLINWRI